MAVLHVCGQRAEIVEWVIQGGGKMVNDQATQNVHFIIECHGVTWRPTDVSQSATVSSHWIRFCLEVNMILILDLVKLLAAFFCPLTYFILYKLILNFLA